jgi:hypothetical protein
MFNVKDSIDFYSLWMLDSTINIPKSSINGLTFSPKGEFGMLWTECLTEIFCSGTAQYFVDGSVRMDNSYCTVACLSKD